MSRQKHVRGFTGFVLAAVVIYSGEHVFRSTTPLNLLVYTKSAVASFEENAQQSGSTRELFQHNVELTREEQRGSWIGNTWVPPHGWVSYSVTELRDFYRNSSVLWIGDSLARRAAGTMYGILNTKAPHVSVGKINRASVIDVNKKSITEPCNRWTNNSHHPNLCRVMPEGGGSFIYIANKCLQDLELFVIDELSGKSNITADVDIIIISLGIWEGEKPWECRQLGDSRSMLAKQNDTIALLNKMQSTRRSVVWRTSGYVADGSNNDFFFEMNEKAMDQIDEIRLGANKTNNLTYVDWGGAIRPRSYGIQRISGDNKAHYGLEARYALIQMISNQFASLRVRGKA